MNRATVLYRKIHPYLVWAAIVLIPGAWIVALAAALSAQFRAR